MALVSATIRTTIEAELPTDSPTDRSLFAGRVAFSLWATSRVRVPPCPLAGSLAPPGAFLRAPWRSLRYARRRLALRLRCRLRACRPTGAAALLCVSFAAASCASPPPPRHSRVSRRASPSVAARRRRGAVTFLGLLPSPCPPATARRSVSRCAAPSLTTVDGAPSRLLVYFPVTALRRTRAVALQCVLPRSSSPPTARCHLCLCASRSLLAAPGAPPRWSVFLSLPLLVPARHDLGTASVLRARLSPSLPAADGSPPPFSACFSLPAIR